MGKKWGLRSTHAAEVLKTKLIENNFRFERTRINIQENEKIKNKVIISFFAWPLLRGELVVFRLTDRGCTAESLGKLVRRSSATRQFSDIRPSVEPIFDFGTKSGATT